MAGRCGCESACTCCSTSSPSIQVGGSGGAGQCFTSAVRYSEDAGNRARAGTDGAVFSDVCLLDPAGDPLEPDGQACLQIPAPGIRTYGGGALIAPNPDGTVSLPTGGPPADFGDGLMIDGGGALALNTSGTWPLTDLQGAFLSGSYIEGSPIFTGPDGKARGTPEHTALTSFTAQTLLEPGLLVVPTSYESPASTPVLISNPSIARQMQVLHSVVAQLDLVNPTDAGGLGVLELRVNGGAWTNYQEGRWPEPLASGTAVRSTLPLSIHRVATIAAGDTFSLETRMRVVKTGSGASPTAVRISIRALLLGVTV